jgi:hypothetical protein
MTNGIKLMLPISALNNSARKRTLAPVITASQLHASIARLVDVGDHHHPVLYGDAKNRDETDYGGNA